MIVKAVIYVSELWIECKGCDPRVHDWSMGLFYSAHKKGNIMIKANHNDS